MKKILILVLALLAFATLLLLPVRPPDHVERFRIQVLNVQALPEGTVQITTLLTNGASVRLHVTDNAAGHPFIAYESGTDDRHALSDLANRLSLSLAPGECLTNLVILTNAPGKFRLCCWLRNLEAEHRLARGYRYVPKFLFQLVAQLWQEQREIPPPCTEWIELNSRTNQTLMRPPG